MKKLFTLFLMTILVTTFFSNSLVAASPIFDLHPAEDLARSVRFDELKVSKSGQFSESDFIALVDSLPLESDQLIVFDLRDECHGLINGMPVYWKDRFHCDCNRSTEEFEHELLKKALNIGHTRIKEKDQNNQLDLAISQAITEREFVENSGHRYVRVPMIDGDLPHDLFMDHFVQFIHNVSPNHWIHFHCRTGGEKATTFSLLSDIIKNKGQMNLEDMLAKHELFSETDLAEFSSEEERLNYMQQKLNFVSEFYTYCQEVPDFSTPWSEWISLQSSFGTSQVKPSQQKLNLIDEFVSEWGIEGCLEWDSEGNCLFEIGGKRRDSNGDYVEGKYRYKDGKGKIIVGTGNEKEQVDKKRRKR